MLLSGLGSAAAGEKLLIAAAADLRFALDEIAVQFRELHPNVQTEVVYGSSGKMTTQILNGAPYDLFFAADVAFPQKLQAAGFAATEPAVYALGRIVLWSRRMDAATLRLEDLADPRFRRIAIAQPAHAPYGQRAKEALIAAGVWEPIQSKLVFGENIAHTAQMVESEAADVGIIALSLALFPTMARHGYALIDDASHAPLTQGFVVTRHGQDNEAAHAFARHMETPQAREVMERFGFVLPGQDPAGIPDAPCSP